MSPSDILKPLSEDYDQVYLGRGLHTLGLITWVLKQIGPADVVVTTFSTAKEFLSGFFLLREKGLVGKATMVADLKAAAKTQKLNSMLKSAFDYVFLAENHSKVVLLLNDKMSVSIITSQNNTYGGRNECTFITAKPDIHDNLLRDISEMINNSHQI